jgi:hypothetical protein
VVSILSNSGGDDDLLVSHYDPDTGWSARQGVESAVGHASQAQIATDGDDRALLVWDQIADRQRVYYALYDGSDWSSPQQAETESVLLRSEEPRVDMNTSGQAVFTWENFIDENTPTVWARYYDPDAGMGAAQRMDNDTDAQEPVAGIDEAGLAHVVFNQDAQMQHIWVRNGNADGWDASPVQVGDAEDWGYDPRIATGPDGTAVIAFARASSGIARVNASVLDPIDGWSDPLLLSTISGQADITAAVAMGDRGDALTLWVRLNQYVHASHYEPGQGWQVSPTVLSGSLDTPAWNPRVVLDTLGQGTAAFNNDNPNDLIVARYLPATGWQDPEAIDTLSTAAGAPALAQWSDGSAIVVWIQGGATWFSILR